MRVVSSSSVDSEGLRLEAVDVNAVEHVILLPPLSTEVQYSTVLREAWRKHAQHASPPSPRAQGIPTRGEPDGRTLLEVGKPSLTGLLFAWQTRAIGGMID